MRRLTALALAAMSAFALVACSHSQTSSQTGSQTGSTAGQSDTGPCNMPGGWHFTAACATGSLDRNGGRFALSDANVVVTLTFGANDATHAHPFIVGMAERASQVEGQLNAQLAFPAYASTTCVNTSRKIVPCAGRAIVYLLVLNPESVLITFPQTPRIAVSGPNLFRGLRRCAVDTLFLGGGDLSDVQWLARPLATAPLSPNLLIVPPTPRLQRYPGGGAFTVFGVVCR